MEWELTGETEVVGENPPQCHFPTTNPTLPNLRLNSGSRDGNMTRYGTAFVRFVLKE
jgi:hypothetical protein